MAWRGVAWHGSYRSAASFCFGSSASEPFPWTSSDPPQIERFADAANVLSGWLPHCKSRFESSAVVGSSLVFGLLVQPLRGLLALMESANRVPFWNAGYAALDIRWGVPAPV